MQKCRAVAAALTPRLVVALFGAFLFSGDFASSDPLPPSASGAGGAASSCDPENVVIYEAPETDTACASDTQMLAADRSYLIDTATPGSTMIRQGLELAIGRLHPEFVRRLAAAIREARQAGLPAVGISSAYRPPAFGVGGFSDKFNSLHTYGLAVDMYGIGGPGSAEAKLWYELAAKRGVTCPYGFENRVEWNHCQPTRIKIVLPENPLRDTVTASGPIDLNSMFEAGNALIESPESVADAVSVDADTTGNRPGAPPTAAENAGNLGRARPGKMNELARTARAASSSENRCTRPHHPRKDACGNSRQVEAARTTRHRTKATPASAAT